jgi:N-acetylglutamate synthase-like GNAT family acetyltransferase
VKIRNAKRDDFFVVVHLLKQFCEERHVPYKDGHLATFVADYLRNEDSVILLAEVAGVPIGMFIGYFCHNIFDGHRLAQERCVFVMPEYRNKEVSHRLFKEFQHWAKEKECTEIILCALWSKDNESLKTVLEWLGCKSKGYIMTKKL